MFSDEQLTSRLNQAVESGTFLESLWQLSREIRLEESDENRLIEGLANLHQAGHVDLVSEFNNLNNERESGKIFSYYVVFSKG